MSNSKLLEKCKKLYKAKKALLYVCELIDYPVPIYRLVKCYKKNDHGHKHRKFYQYHLSIGEHSFSGESLSKRLAKREVAFEAIKHLMFRKCDRSTATDLVQFCDDHHLLPPVFIENYQDNFFTFSVELNIYVNYTEICLTGKGCSNLFRLAKEAAAKDILDQLKVIYEHASL